MPRVVIVDASQVRVSLTNTAPTRTADSALLGGSLLTEHLGDGGCPLSMNMPTSVHPVAASYVLP